MKKLNYVQYVIVTLFIFIFCSCNSGNMMSTQNTNLPNSLTLQTDQISYIPLFKGKSTAFYFYVRNVGNNDIYNLKWSIISSNHLDPSLAKIVDQTDCKQLIKNMSCRLIIVANKVGNIQIQVTSTQKNLPLNYSWNIEIKNYVLPKISNMADALTLAGIKNIKLYKNNGSLSFFIVNNSKFHIVLNPYKPLKNLSGSAKVIFAACPNPIPSRGYCQIRLAFSPQNQANLNDFYVPLRVNAKFMDNTGVIEDLPPQNDSPVELITRRNLVNPQFVNIIPPANLISRLKSTPGTPVIYPNLSIVANSLFNQNITQAVSTTSNSYIIQLTNNSIESDPSGSNVGDPTLFIPYQALTPTNASGFTYSVNGNNLANPCKSKSGTFPTPSSMLVIHQGETCSYNLYITASASPVTTAIPTSVVTSFNYFVYTQNSPNHPTFATSFVTNSFNISSYTPKATLDIAVASSSNINAFSGVVLSSASPNMTFTITNNGTSDLNGGLSTQGLSLATFTPNFDQACYGLKVGAQCNLILTMSTANIISGNLNTASIIYSAGQVSFPNVNYSVINQVPPPNVTEKTIVTGCYVGDGVVSTCFNNPDSMGGNASTIQVRFLFSNSSATAVESLVISSNIDSDLTSKGYILDTTNSNCNGGISANGGTCQIIYNIPPNAASLPLQSNITDNNFAYVSSYNGGKIADGKTTLTLNINVVAPSISIATINGMVFESGFSTTVNNVSILLSSLYQNSAPAINNTVTNSSGAIAPGITATSSGCMLQSISNSAICSSQISLNNNASIGSYNFNATLYNATLFESAKFNIFNPTIFITRETFTLQNLGGIAGADQNCTNSAAKSLPLVNFKALLISPGRYPCNRFGLCGGANSIDWPLLNSGVSYYSPNGQYFNQVNANFVFDGSQAQFQDASGIPLDENSQFWFGVQSIHINNSLTDIDAWAYDIESSSYINVYNNYVTSCNNYTGNKVTNNAPPNIGITGISPQYFSAYPNIPSSANAWGQWHMLMDNYAAWFINTWSAENQQLVNNPSSCNQDQLHLVCVTPF